MESNWSVENIMHIVENGFVNKITLLYIIKNDICTEYNGYTLDIPYNGIEPGFIPYEDLTEQQILSWCFESMKPGEKEAIEDETLVSFQKLEAWTQNQLDTTSGIPWES